MARLLLLLLGLLQLQHYSAFTTIAHRRQRLLLRATKETQELLDRVAQLRNEIAELEGKTVAEVEEEAQAKAASLQANLEEQQRSVAQESPAARKDMMDGRWLSVPVDGEGQVQLAARAIERAYQDGITRQTIRLALVREGEPVYDFPNWPGGPEQMLREAAKPLTTALMREVRTQDRVGGFWQAPNVTVQDIWNFDGSAMVTAQAAQGPEGDAQALIFPNTDAKYTKDIQEIDEVMGERPFILVNPFWRSLDSWGINLLQPRGKALAKAVIFDRGFDCTFAFLRLSVRGENCVALKAYPYDWQLFAFAEQDEWPFGDTAVRLGSSAEEPSSAYFQELLDAHEFFQLSRNMRQIQKRFK